VPARLKPFALLAAIMKMVVLALVLVPIVAFGVLGTQLGTFPESIGELIEMGGYNGEQESSNRGPALPEWWRYQTGRSYVSDSGYIEYIAGDAPLIISAPHGGLLEPSHIPDRSGVVAHDSHTLELARLIADAYFQLTGKRPHVVINLLHRKKLDANRDLIEAAEGHPDAQKAWREFHAAIEEAKDLAVDMYGWGFYVDLHGHSHSHQRVELGYGLSADDLRLSDDALNAAEFAARSSLGNLCSPSGNATPLAELLRGPMSLGAILERHGVKSVPSDVEPAPRPGWGYFSGGYNTKRHGARDGGPVSGVQVEVNSNWRRDRGTRAVFAHSLARAIVEFLGHHAGLEACDSSIRVRIQRPNGRSGILMGAVLTGATRLEFETAVQAVRSVQIEIDGDLVYQGDSLPSELEIDPAALAHGSHAFRVAVVGERDERHEYTATFHVRHFSVDASWHDGPLEAVTPIAGEIRILVVPEISKERMGRLTVRLKPVRSITGEEVVLFDDIRWQADVRLDTRELQDGLYDLVVSAETVDGIRTDYVERIDIDNWNVLEDALLPPRVGGWMGTVEMLKVIHKTDGWVHVTDRPDNFAGDADRLKAQAGRTEQLTWKLDNLRAFEISLFASSENVGNNVSVSVSHDREHWTDVTYRSTAIKTGEGIYKIVIAGSLPGDPSADYLRLTVTGDDSEAGLQVGNVKLRGASELAARMDEVKK